MWVARAASRFPVILEYLKSGKLHLTAISYLTKHLTEDNHQWLLENAQKKSETQLRWWLSTLFPEKTPADWQLDGKEKIMPFDGERAKLQLVVDREFVELLERNREIHKHKHPEGSALELLKRALREDLKRHDPKMRRQRRKAREEKKATPKKENARTQKAEPVGSQPAARKDNGKIPCGIKDRAWEIYDDQCAYVSGRGNRCTERAGLEADHKIARAKGGSSKELSNTQPLCMMHNRWKARVEFGKDFRKTTPASLKHQPSMDARQWPASPRSASPSRARP